MNIKDLRKKTLFFVTKTLQLQLRAVYLCNNKKDMTVQI